MNVQQNITSPWMYVIITQKNDSKNSKGLNIKLLKLKPFQVVHVLC